MTDTERLQEAELIIRELLTVLHDRNGKKRIADKARVFLGLKPGQAVATGYDRMNLRTPGWGDRCREIHEQMAAKKAAGV